MPGFDPAEFGRLLVRLAPQEPRQAEGLVRDISKTDTEAYYEGDHDPAYLVRAGNYLIGMDGDFNLRRWTGPDGLLNQRVMRVNGWRCEIDPEFVKLSAHHPPAAPTSSSSWSTIATKRRDDTHVKSWLCGMGRRLRRSRRCYRAARPPAAPRHLRPDRGRELPPPCSCRSDPGTHARTRRNHAAAAAQTPRAATEEREGR